MRRYRQFVAESIPQGRRPDLQGGGRRRNVGGWEGLTALRRGRERWAFDERVLGSGPFVDRVLAEVAARQDTSLARAWGALPRLLARLAGMCGVTDGAITGGSRRRPAAAARAAVGPGASTWATSCERPGERKAIKATTSLNPKRA